MADLNLSSRRRHSIHRGIVGQTTEQGEWNREPVARSGPMAWRGLTASALDCIGSRNCICSRLHRLSGSHRAASPTPRRSTDAKWGDLEEISGSVGVGFRHKKLLKISHIYCRQRKIIVIIKGGTVMMRTAFTRRGTASSRSACTCSFHEQYSRVLGPGRPPRPTAIRARNGTRSIKPNALLRHQPPTAGQPNASLCHQPPTAGQSILPLPL